MTGRPPGPTRSNCNWLRTHSCGAGLILIAEQTHKLVMFRDIEAQIMLHTWDGNTTVRKTVILSANYFITFDGTKLDGYRGNWLNHAHVTLFINCETAQQTNNRMHVKWRMHWQILCLTQTHTHSLLYLGATLFIIVINNV